MVEKFQHTRLEPTNQDLIKVGKVLANYLVFKVLFVGLKTLGIFIKPWMVQTFQPVQCCNLLHNIRPSDHAGMEYSIIYTLIYIYNLQNQNMPFHYQNRTLHSEFSLHFCTFYDHKIRYFLGTHIISFCLPYQQTKTITFI